MTTYRFKLSKAALGGCIGGILLGFIGLGFTVYRILGMKIGFTSVQSSLQHSILILTSVLAIALFTSILIRSVYKITEKELILWFGFIKSSYKLDDITAIHLFTKTNKLVLYFDEEKYTVIVIKSEWIDDFIKEILSRNNKIKYDSSEEELKSED